MREIIKGSGRSQSSCVSRLDAFPKWIAHFNLRQVTVSVNALQYIRLNLNDLMILST